MHKMNGIHKILLLFLITASLMGRYVVWSNKIWGAYLPVDIQDLNLRLGILNSSKHNFDHWSKISLLIIKEAIKNFKISDFLNKNSSANVYWHFDWFIFGAFFFKIGSNFVMSLLINLIIKAMETSWSLSLAQAVLRTWSDYITIT